MSSFIKTFQPDSLNEFEFRISEGTVILIELDGAIYNTREVFIRAFYDSIIAPDTFGLNWNAFWDTITDQQFWIKKPLILIIKNKKKLFKGSNEVKDRLSFDSILIDLVQYEGYSKNDYYIFISE